MLTRLPLMLLACFTLFFVAQPLAAPKPALAANCEFVLGFKILHDLIPDKVGDCKTNEYHNPQNGDGLQETTGGLLVWRKADNWTAFTDGYRTWINGPKGLQSRLNTERFDWEAVPPVQTQTLGPIWDPLYDSQYSMEIAVNRVRWDRGESYWGAKPGNTFVIADVSIKNLGPGPSHNVSRSMFKALDANGVLHDTEYLVKYNGCSLDWVDLLPNGQVQGCVAFEVPDHGAVSLIYAPYMYEGMEPGRFLSFTLRP